MFEYVIAALVLGGAYGTVELAKAWRRSRTQKALPAPEKKEENPYASLFGIRGGVWIREPNSSEHPVQNMIEQELCRHGMALFNLNRDSVEKLLKQGEWDNTIAPKKIDVAAIGRIVVQVVEKEEVKYPTIQHIDTRTGKHLNSVHPKERSATTTTTYCFGSGGCPLSGTTHIHESDAEYEWRREQEKQIYPVRKQLFSLDVRFYGTDGTIRGGCVVQAPDKHGDPLAYLVESVTGKLAEAAKTSIKAHSHVEALAEIDGDVATMMSDLTKPS